MILQIKAPHSRVFSCETSGHEAMLVFSLLMVTWKHKNTMSVKGHSRMVCALDIDLRAKKK